MLSPERSDPSAWASELRSTDARSAETGAPTQNDVDAFARIHVGRPTPPFISNLTTQIELLGSGVRAVPVTINGDERDNAWVCSPYTAYCAYAIEELERLAHPLVTRPLSWLCRAAGASLRRAEIDRAVAINNWLLSTNLYPSLDRATLRSWIAESRKRWPAHSIWFRSLNDAWTSDWIAALVAEGFELIPSRQVYLYSDIADLPRRHSDLKADLKLLERTPLRQCGPEDFGPVDWPRIEALYGKLYLEKYSRLNPAYRASFMEAWHRAGLLRLVGFRDAEGVLQAIAGTFEREGVVTAPLVGYDTALPQKLGLYRLLMAAVLKYAADSGQRVNLSAGAAGFKRMRGGVPAIEYSAVFVRHLPMRRQRAIERLRWLTERIGVPLMKRFEL
jgi:hypothetical protein